MRSSLLPLICSLAAPISVLSQTEPLWDGNPPEGVNPLALGLYTTPEVLEPVELEIVGEIPSWVTGSLYRGAQAGWDAGNYTSEHWFDGFSRNHRFEIADGKVTYRSRNASDEVVDFIRETGLYPGRSFGGDPCKVILGAFEATFRTGPGTHGDKDRDSIKISYVKNFPGLSRNSTNFGPLMTLVSTTDGTSNLQQFDPVTLEPIELFTYNASTEGVVGTGLTSAHPAIGENGEVYNYILDLATETPVYQVFGILPGGHGKVLANITDAPPAYIHSIFSTENYVVLIVWQADFGPPPTESTPILDFIQDWDPERPVFFYVVSKTGEGVVAKYTFPTSFFAFHEVNSFEQDGDIIIDIPTMPDTTYVKEAAKMEYMRKNFGVANQTIQYDLQSKFQRYRLPNFAAGKAQNGTLVEDTEAILDFELSLEVGGIELPKLNEKYLHKPYRYAYGVHTVKPGYLMDSIIKIDTHTQTSKIWVPDWNHVPSEPIFVERPGCEDEDDGVLLTVALDSTTSLSSMIVLDAKTMEEIGRARLPVVVGFGFHGIWGGEEMEETEGRG